MSFVRTNKKLFLLFLIFFLLSGNLVFALDFSENNIEKLRDNWEFYWEEFLYPEDFQKENFQDKGVLIDIPTDLTKEENRLGTYPTDTYGTFRKTIIVDEPDNVYGLKAPYFSAANKIWINGKLLSSSGQVADNKKDFIPKYSPSEVYFAPGSEKVEIIIQIANFHHRRIKLKDIYFGKAEDIKNLTQNNLMKESALVGGLLLISIYYAVLYFIQNKVKASIYLSLLSFVVAMRGTILTEKIALHIFPGMSGEVLMKVGFLPSFLFLPLIALYIKEVFKIKEIEKYEKIIKSSIVAFVLLVFFMPGRIYDLAFNLLNFIFVPLALGIIYIMISNKEYRKMRGYKLMVSGSAILFFTAINDILSEFTVLNTPEMFSTGIFLFIVIQAVFLAWEFTHGLEEKIKERTRELEDANKKLEIFSTTDALTGLHNRRGFEERLEGEWQKVIQDNKPLSALLFDIDFFKDYNDNYGHISGDECLIKVAKSIKDSVAHQEGFAARFGGEEFIVLLPETDLATSKDMAEKIRKNIENLQIPHNFSKVKKCITVSGGVTTADPFDKEISSKDFLKMVDEYLYIAKNMGRNKIASNNTGGDMLAEDS